MPLFQSVILGPTAQTVLWNVGSVRMAKYVISKPGCAMVANLVFRLFIAIRVRTSN